MFRLLEFTVILKSVQYRLVGKKIKTWSIGLHHGAPEILKIYLWQKETESLIHPVLEYLDICIN